MDELNERIAKIKGWVELKPGTVPGWLRPDSKEPTGYSEEYCPTQWSSDNDAAMGLLEALVSDGETSFSLIYYQSMKCYQCEIFTNRRMRNANGATPAEAISRAWLAWMEA